MSDGLDPDRDESFLAAEYALGVLGTRDRRLAERLIREDQAFSASVASWEARLGPLALAVEPVAAPAEVWRAIESGLPAARSSSESLSMDAPRRLVAAFWKWLAIGSMGVAAASLVGIAWISNAPVPSPLAAAIVATDGVPLFTAVIDRSTGTATLIPVSMGAAPDRVPELWFIPAGAQPISMGVIDPRSPLRIDLSKGRMAGAPWLNGTDAVLAITMEPQGGSPSGAPTGPVVGQGPLGSV